MRVLTTITRTILLATLTLGAAVALGQPRAVEASAPLSAPLAAKPRAPVVANDAAADLTRAEETLANLKGAYRHLDGVTVEIGDTPAGEEAVAYYRENRIVISSRHSESITTILAHEMWHIIDWQEDGSLDWGENVPPAGASTYTK